MTSRKAAFEAGMLDPAYTSKLTRQVRREFLRRTGEELVKVCSKCGLPTIAASAGPRYFAFRWWRRAKGPLRRVAFLCLVRGHAWRYI
jgi:hypothetical protein